MLDDPNIIKRRIEAAVLQAQMNAQATGGDNAIAALDLLCAFVLISVKSGVEPDAAFRSAWDSAQAVVSDFWPSERVN